MNSLEPGRLCLQANARSKRNRFVIDITILPKEWQRCRHHASRDCVSVHGTGLLRLAAQLLVGRPQARKGRLTIMDTAEYYRDLYKAEWDYRQTIGGAAAVPIGALTVLGGLLGYLAREADLSQGVTGPVIVVAGALAAAAFVVASFMVIRAFHGYTYRRIPFADELRTWEKQVEAAVALGTADAAFFSRLKDRYSEAAGKNVSPNVEMRPVRNV